TLIERLRGWLHDQNVLIRACFGDAGAAREVAMALLDENHPARRAVRGRAVARVLASSFLSQEILNDYWELFAQTRDQSLVALLARCDHPGGRGLEVRTISCLYIPSGEHFLEKEELIAVCLILAGSLDRPAPEGERARRLLGSPGWIGRLARVCLRDDCPETALGFLVERGFLPEEPEERAVFLFLTGQMERWRELDPDHRLLALAYSKASPGLAGRIRAQVRHQGSGELARVVLQPMTLPGGAGWETLLELVRDRPDELWKLVLEAPLLWSARALRQLDSLRSQPAEADLYRALRLQCPDPALLEEVVQSEQILLSVQTDRLELHPASSQVVYRGPACALTLTDLTHSSPSTLFGHLAGELQCYGRTGDFWTEAVERLDALAFHPGGRLLASGGADGMVIVWDLEKKEQLYSLQCAARSGDGRKFRLLAFGSGWLVIWHAGNTVRLLDLATGAYREIFREVEGCLTISEAGARVALGCPDRVEVVKLPSLERSTLTLDCPFPEPFVEALAISADGNQLAVGQASRAGLRRVLCWSGKGWQVCEPETGELTSLTFSPDGASLLCQGEKALMVLDLATGRVLAELAASAFCFSADGSLLVTVGWGETQLRNARTFELVGTMANRQINRQVLGCWFLPDGRLIVCWRRLDGYQFKLELAQLTPLLNRPLGSMRPADLELAHRVLPSGGRIGRVREYLRLVLQHRFRTEVQLGERGSPAHDIELA
ncbi:hypothetical protein DYH09_24105, partial [bacterium CPR1]|nr:hypothetical protein [bacterium CPR1]